MCLVDALSPNFAFGPSVFFYLTLVDALCKTFGVSPSVKYLLKKKKPKLTVCRVDQSWHTTRHTKRQIFIIKIN